MLELPPLSLYVHIPWCVRKCPYCDFNSHRAPDHLPEESYLAALKRDLEACLTWVGGRKLVSIFIGGGTPSLFSSAAIEQILQLAEKSVGFCEDIEITLEANPGTFEQARFSAFRAAGVNRLSIGVQSFSDLHLQQLGRIHGEAEALAAIDMARLAGFDNINIDLMHGLPGQTISDARRDLDIAIQQAPEHLSWYQLTIEPNTEFYSRPPTLPKDDELADIQQIGEQLLAQAGLRRYEVSAFARPRRQSRHNVNYWQFGDYLGIGAGAHSKMTDLESNHIIRQQKTRMPEHYLDAQCDQLARSNRVMKAELPLEFMMNALRLIDGVNAQLYTARTGLSLEALDQPLQKLRSLGLLKTNESQLQTSPAGTQFLNEVLAEFV